MTRVNTSASISPSPVMSSAPGSAVASAPGNKKKRGPRVSRSPVDPRTLPTVGGALSMIVEGLEKLLSGYERAMREEAGRFYANERSRQEEILTLNVVCERYHMRKSAVMADIDSGKLKAEKVPCKSKDGSVSSRFTCRIKAADADAWDAARTAKAPKNTAAASAIPGRGASFYADSGTSSISKSVPPTGSSRARPN